MPMLIDDKIRQRFWSHVRIIAESDCWYWAGARTDRYGRMRVQGKQTYAHRLSLVIAGNELDPDRVVDHRCRNTFCVNPTHLEQVTQLENMRRGAHATKTHCKHGHEYTPENTRIDSYSGSRRCRMCLGVGSARIKRAS